MKKYFLLCLLVMLISEVGYAQQPQVVTQTDYGVCVVAATDVPALDYAVFAYVDYVAFGLAGECPIVPCAIEYSGSVQYPAYEVVFHKVDITGTNKPPHNYMQ